MMVPDRWTARRSGLSFANPRCVGNRYWDARSGWGHFLRLTFAAATLLPLLLPNWTGQDRTGRYGRPVTHGLKTEKHCRNGTGWHRAGWRKPNYKTAALPDGEFNNGAIAGVWKRGTLNRSESGGGTFRRNWFPFTTPCTTDGQSPLAIPW
jgi:hypothetical protein